MNIISQVKHMNNKQEEKSPIIDTILQTFVVWDARQTAL